MLELQTPGTSDVTAFTLQFSSCRVNLIDTPGFDDTYKTDLEVLKDVAFWLNQAYKAKVRLSGIIYLHRITDTRMTGSMRKNLRMFKKLCGMENLSSVVLATTMWENLKGEATGVSREEQLKSTPDFWKDMIDNGSHVFRHMNNQHSAMNIIEFILRQEKLAVLAIQKQMAVEGKSLEETAAGIELAGELRKQRELFERRLKESQEEMRQALEENDKQAAQELAEQQERFQRQIDDAEKARNNLKVSLEKLYEEKDQQFQQLQHTYKTERERLEQGHAQMRLELQVVSKEAEKAREKQAKMERQQRAMERQHRNMEIRMMNEQMVVGTFSQPVSGQGKKVASKREVAAVAGLSAGAGAGIGAVALVACTVM